MVPPLLGFFAKFTVLLAAIHNGYIFLALIGIIASVISAAYYLRVIKVLYFENPDLRIEKVQSNSSVENYSRINEEEYQSNIYLSNSLSLTISVLTLIIVLFALKPNLILNSAHLLALSLYYF